MDELIRTNNPVTISFVEALLKEADIAYFVADQNMSILEGSIGILQKRILVDSDAVNQARRVLIDAGLEEELQDKKP